MALLKKSAVAAKKATRAALGKRVALGTAKHVSRQKKAAILRGVPHVSVTTAGGYTVFGSPVRPAHLTTEQIAQAIAELD